MLKTYFDESSQIMGVRWFSDNEKAGAHVATGFIICIQIISYHQHRITIGAKTVFFLNSLTISLKA
jgi:hypothetical protein